MTDLPDVKLRALANFPVSVTGRTAINVVKVNGKYYFDLDVSGLVKNTNISSDQVAQSWSVVWNEVLDAYQIVPFALGATAGVASLALKTGALDIGAGLEFTGDTLELDIPYVETFVPEVLAWKHGVPGDSTDQTGALQAIVNALPQPGAGIIRIKGDVVISSLDLTGKENFTFEGDGNIFGPNTGLSFIRTTAGAIGSGVPVIDCYGATNLTFKGLGLYQSNVAFNGTMVRCGATTPTVDTSIINFKKCILGGTSSTATMLWFYGGVICSLEDCLVQGAGVSVQLQDVAAVGRSNVIQLSRTNFAPNGNVYPIQGSGDVIKLSGCNFQAGPDGRGRAIQGSSNYPFRGVSIDNCGFYDATVGGFTWIKIPLARGVDIKSSFFGGVAAASTYAIELGGAVDPVGADPGISGVGGFEVSSNDFENFAAAINFAGNPSALVLSCARAGEVFANKVIVGALFANLANCGGLRTGFNDIYDSADLFGGRPGYHGLPTAAGGMASGSVYSDSGTLKVVP